MTTLNELAIAALETVTGTTGTFDELVQAWLSSATGRTGPVNDLWHDYLTAQGIPAGPLSQRQLAYFRGLGYTGTLNEAMYAFWANGGPSNLTESLVAWYDLEEASGTRIDAHSTNDLTPVGTPGRRVMVQGFGSDTNGTTQYLGRAMGTGTPLNNAGDFTVAAWVEMDTNGATYNMFVSLNDYSSSGISTTCWWLANLTSTNRFELGVVDSSQNFQSAVASSFGAPSLATKYLVIGEYVQATRTLGISVNAGTVDTATLTFQRNTVGTADLILGAYKSGFFYGHDGGLDEVAIWNRVLTQAEKERIYNSGSGVTYADIS